MKAKAAAFALAALLLAPVANAENFGGVPRKFEQRVERIVRLWFKGAADRFICVIRHESGYNTTAFNDDEYPLVRYSLFQTTYPLWSPANPAIRRDARYGSGMNRRMGRAVMRFWHGRQVTRWQFQRRLFDPVQATRFAYMMYRAGGFSPWVDTGC